MKGAGAAELNVFIAIATHGSFRRAAIELVVTPSALSHALRPPEERLAIRLFNRTTRSVALMEAGERLFARLRPAFRDISSRPMSRPTMKSVRGSPPGLVRKPGGSGFTGCEGV